MSPRIVLAAMALIPASAIAQAADPAEKSVDQISCELTDGCETAASAGQIAPPTRSWSIGTVSTAGKAVAGGRTQQAYSANSPQPAKRSSQAMVSTSAGRNIQEGARRSSLGINFAVNSAELTDRGRRQADELYRAISSSQLAGKHFLVGGHTDASGDAAENLNLSRMRAQTLVEYLVDKGAARSRFRARGYGEEQLLSGVNSNSPSNRRVEIVRLD